MILILSLWHNVRVVPKYFEFLLFSIVEQLNINIFIFSEYKQDPDVNKDDIVLLDVHYKSRTMIKFRTDVVFGILDLIAAFGGTLKVHICKNYNLRNLLLFRNRRLVFGMFNSDNRGIHISCNIFNHFKVPEDFHKMKN